MGALLRKLTVEQWTAIDEAYLDRPLPDRRVMWVLLTAALALILPIYVGSPKFAAEQPWLRPAFAVLPDPKMGPRLYWAVFKLLNYLLLPMLCIKLALGDSVRSHGLALHRDRTVWALYAGLLALVLPFVVFASTQPSFLAKYPRYSDAGASWAQLLLWESAYGFQFAALEFFFRGFLLFALARSMGSAAVFVSMVPYVMIHLRKPLPETLGSIASGVVLGTLALRTRSIYGGVVVHCGVAWAMDGLALLHHGDLARLLGMR